ncbi:MAG TPA: hypothetical protein VHY37_10855 [Tepidisphaeraceae bacterium]|jgi:hypothetical protein|nr:hypothetical protein [Tepidisphaeraceae bacterium]
MTEEYSSPLAREAARIIRIADASSFAGSMGKFLLGLGVCFIAGIFIATFIYAILDSLFGHTLLTWAGWFWLYVLVLVPLLVWYERRYRQDYLLEATTSADSSSTTGEFRVNQFNLATSVISSLIVWGPRGLADGIRGMIGRRTVLQSAVLDRAVLLVLDLNCAPGGVDVKKLIHPPEDMHIFGQSVDMLDALDLIGRSKDGGNIWLISTFRQKLVDFNKSAPPA